MTTGERIKAAREKKGWTQKELADRAGFCPQHISNLECARFAPSQPTSRTLMALERALRIKLVK